MLINPEEIKETIEMIQEQRLDIRTVTMGLSLRDCIDTDGDRLLHKIYQKVTESAGNLVGVAESLQKKYSIPIVNKRVAVSAISVIAEASDLEDYVPVAEVLDKTAKEIGIDFIGGFSALVHKGETPGDTRLIDSIPRALSRTERLCSSVNVASSKAGINMDAVLKMAEAIKETAELTRDRDGIGCGKLVVFANIPEDNPFMAGAYHGFGEPDRVINVGISGPGVVRATLEKYPDADLMKVSEIIKQTAFKITRMGELIGRESAALLNATPGVVDLSLAPTPTPGDSVARIIEVMGIERCGAPGSTAALALLNDAVKKGGAMATSSTGGLSGAFIPVSEDSAMAEAAAVGALSIEKLEAMTAVCSVGLDMIVIPGDTQVETIAGIIADQMAIAVINHKAAGVRLIPAPGKGAGESVIFGDLLGSAPVMPVSRFSSKDFVRRGGRIPAPLTSLNN
ncbi:MAG TPA: PFL family protein [Anaerolineae bacterium]|nr:PFL family protein [Anaerolineae bacterium]